MQFKYSVLAASLAAALTLSGCGGGGDSSPAPAGNTGGNTGSNTSGNTGGSEDQPIGGGVVITSVDITAMDGYLINALVCSDVNNNGTCDRGEDIGVTDKNGKLDNKFKFTKEKAAEIKANPIVIKVLQPFVNYSKFGVVEPGTYTVDKDQQYQPMDKNVVLRAPAGAEIVSPLTDLIVAEMSNGKDLEEAETSVQEMLSGLTVGSDAEIDLYADYIQAKGEEAGNSEAEKELAAKLHKTAQILTETKDSAEASDEKLDEVISEVVVQAVDSVKTSSAEDIKDPNYKPSVPVSDTGEVTPAVTNYQAVVSEEIKTALQKELTGTEFKTKVDITFTSTVHLDGLVSDQNTTNNNPVVSITGMMREGDQKETDLTAYGLDVQLKGQYLEIRSLNGGQQSLAKSGTYTIELSADDVDSQLKTVGKVKALVKFEVKPYNNAPTIVQETKEAIQEKIGSLSLQAKEEMQSISIVLDRLFTDADGDSLTLSVTGLPAGIHYDQEALLETGTLQLAGTPAVSGKNNTFTVTATDTDGESVEATFTLPEIAPAQVTDNTLTDLLVGKTIYNATHEWIEESNLPYAQCWNLKLAADNTVWGADGDTEGNCPTEADLIQNGSWKIDGDNIVATMTEKDHDGKDKTIVATLGLLADHSGDDISHIHVIVQDSVQPNWHPVTFHLSQQDMEAYLANNVTELYINGKFVEADAHAIHGYWTEREDLDNIDVDLFIATSCEILGYEKGTGIHENQYLDIGEARYEFFAMHPTLGSVEPLPYDIYATGGGTECAIDFDYSDFTKKVQAGEVISIVAEAKTNDGDGEEVVVNAFVDRNEIHDSLIANDTVNFIGTKWKSEYTDYGQPKVEIVTYSEAGATYTDESGKPQPCEEGETCNEDGLYPWDGVPSDLPCLYGDEHTCTIGELNSIYNFCDADDTNTTWSECDDEDRYAVKWMYNPEEEVLYRLKRSLSQGYMNKSSMTLIK